MALGNNVCPIVQTPLTIIFPIKKIANWVHFYYSEPKKSQRQSPYKKWIT
jgi:hypothetical protein